MTLTTLFLDLNAYFASVEQQLRPELRGRPVAVVPMLADRTCCIAASYEARPFGVRTGTAVHEAKRLCPHIVLVEARPREYVRIHHEILDAIDACIPVHKVYSIDECACRLVPAEASPEAARALALRIKRSVRERVGEMLRCSIGVATNRFLAKVASDMHKPDGLTIIRREDLPHALHPLELRDLPGVAHRMEARIRAKGVHSVAQLCDLPVHALEDIWESVLGRHWWHWLRGDDVADIATHRRTIGHEHVLPPEQRNDADARAVLVRLLSKAAARTRREGYWATRLRVRTDYLGGAAWREQATFAPCQDTLTLIGVLSSLWARRSPRVSGSSRPDERLIPYIVGVRLEGLEHHTAVTPPLFDEAHERNDLSRAIDRANERHGVNTVYLASMHGARDSAPMRIAFGAIPDLTLPDVHHD
ncbi:MAG: DNA polymerase [Phycisphaerales bacterium]|nr:MAG: DNA polymerase [Phycisphaerales bacterium]